MAAILKPPLPPTRSPTLTHRECEKPLKITAKNNQISFFKVYLKLIVNFDQQNPH